MYTTAIDCAVNDDLRKEWQKYLEQTTHEQVMTDVLTKLGLDVDTRRPVAPWSPHRRVAGRRHGEGTASGTPEAAELVAGECVVSAETKDHLNWELIGRAAEAADKATAEILDQAADEVEDEEDEHLYHTTGWTRELWLQSLGIEAVLPPPEERKHVTTAIGAARAKNARDEMTNS